MILDKKKSNHFILSALVMTFIISESSSLRILGLFPHHGVSHFHFIHPIMLALAEAGHNVTVLSQFPDTRAPSNYKDLVIRGQTNLSDTVDMANLPYFRFPEFFELLEWGKQSCEITLNSNEMEEVLKMTDLDVIIVEQFNTDCMLGVAWKLKAPIIGVSSCAVLPYHYDRFGIPFTASYYPVTFLGHTDKMTFSQRFANWLGGHAASLMRRLFMDRSDNEILRRKFGEEIPPVAEIAKNISLVFMNTHYSLSGPRALPPSVIELGGMHITEPKPIPDTLKHILDSAEHGVIYVSWGSMIRAKSLPVEKRESLLKAFSSFKQIVLWKWENQTLPNQPPNVHIMKWMPQREILCHPNVLVFLTHGGMLGSSEAAYCGVPVVATPVYGDQFLNSAALVDRGMGTIVNFNDITKETIENAIKFALQPSTREKAKIVSYSYKNRPKDAKETSVWWVEHIASTKGSPLLKTHLTFMSWYEYYLLDVYAVLACGISIFIGSWVWMIRLMCGGKNTKLTKVKTK